MLRIIGHRGARGLAPENTIAAIKAAIAAGVDGIEFDIQITADKQLVLSHDPSLDRYGENAEAWKFWQKKGHKISSLGLEELKQVTSEIGQPIPTLQEALTAAKDTPVIIEGKGDNWAKHLGTFLATHPKKSQCTVIAFNHHELFTFGQYCPSIPCFALENRNPFDAINDARIFGFDGIDVNYWVLNPLAYWLAKRHKFEVVVYTVNKPWIASFFKLLYPKLSITTDNPHKMQFLRPKRLRVKPVKPKKGLKRTIQKNILV